MTGLMADIAGASAGEFLFGMAVVAIAGAGALIAALVSLKRLRLIQDTPTARIRSAPQGYVELSGYAKLIDGPPIHAPLSHAPCVWWRYKIEERRTSFSNGRRRTRWVTVDQGTSDDLFKLVDDTGECIVDPDAATVVPGVRHRWHGQTRRPTTGPKTGIWGLFGRYRYYEQLIPPLSPLYALGQFRSQGVHHSFDQDSQVRHLLVEWKRDQARLLAEFDADGDGSIDLDEWEAVRTKAMETVRQQLAKQATESDLHVLSRPPDRRPFLLSAVPQEKLTSRYRLRAALAFAGFLLAMAGLAVGATARGLI